MYIKKLKKRNIILFAGHRQDVTHTKNWKRNKKKKKKTPNYVLTETKQSDFHDASTIKRAWLLMVKRLENLLRTNDRHKMLVNIESIVFVLVLYTRLEFISIAFIVNWIMYKLWLGRGERFHRFSWLNWIDGGDMNLIGKFVRLTTVVKCVNRFEFKLRQCCSSCFGDCDRFGCDRSWLGYRMLCSYFNCYIFIYFNWRRFRNFHHICWYLAIVSDGGQTTFMNIPLVCLSIVSIFNEVRFMIGNEICRVDPTIQNRSEFVTRNRWLNTLSNILLLDIYFVIVHFAIDVNRYWTNVRLWWMMQLIEADPMVLPRRIEGSTDHCRSHLDNIRFQRMRKNSRDYNFRVDNRTVMRAELPHFREDLYAFAHLLEAQRSIASRRGRHENYPDYLFADKNELIWIKRNI